MKSQPLPYLLLCSVLAIAGCGDRPLAGSSDTGAIAGWPEYGGDKGGLRYSSLAQITPANVNGLQVAWTYRSGDFSNGSAAETKTSFNVTPILVDDQLVFCTPYNRVIALDPETGGERWSFDPEVRNQHFNETPYTRACRGVAF